MTVYRLPYGHEALPVDLAAAVAAGHAVDTLAPKPAEAAADPVADVERALATAALPEYRGGGCAVAINDHTRPVPHGLLLPALTRRLARAGVPRRDIVFLIAAGTHPVMPPERFGEVVPAEILQQYHVTCHDADRRDALSFLGRTSRGTPIWVNRAYVEAALRVVVGAVDPHQFGGFSGGVKSAAIGLAGRETVERNHSMMTHPLAQIGRYDDNPVRQDIEEIGARVGVHLALDVILREGKDLVRAFAGLPAEVMREAIPHVRALNQAPVEALYDLLIVSPGGHPKDLNLYQAQKALAHASIVARPGATILVAAACPDGTGSRAYEDWMAGAGMTSHEAVIARFLREGYRIGPHKAYQISRDASRFRVLLYSGMPASLVTRLLLTPVTDFGGAIQEAVAALPPRSRIAVMPFANATIPLPPDEVSSAA